MASAPFIQLLAALQNRGGYPQNLHELLGPQHAELSPRELNIGAMEGRVAAAVWHMRKQMPEHEAERIVTYIFKALAPTTCWVYEGSVCPRRAKIAECDIPSHSVFLSQITKIDPVRYRDSAQPDLFQRLVCAVILKYTPPKLNLLQLITLALIDTGAVRIADESEIGEWIKENIPFYSECRSLRLALLVHMELTTVFNSDDRALEPIDPAIRNRGLEYEKEHKGLVWRLPTCGEHRVFEDLYPPGHELLWAHPRPFLPSQAVARLPSITSIDGIQPPTHCQLPMLENLPVEILQKIGKYCALGSTTVHARRKDDGIKFDDIEFFQRTEDCTIPNLNGVFKYCTLRSRVRKVDLREALPLCPVAEIYRAARGVFLTSNHFVLNDIVHGYFGAVLYGPTNSPLYATHLAWEVLGRFGVKNARLLTSISLELYADVLEHYQESYPYDYVNKVNQVLSFLLSTTNLRCLKLGIRWDGVGVDHEGGIPHPQVFQMLSRVRGINSVEICGLDDYPGLSEQLIELMTSQV